ncbi:hypothetical protein [Paenibacillus campi]|uniref:hypothetical protein n=1 Tax=Paenibacillus campi TaxID=3106031 RepID=UPI002AFEC6F9|nr:hypothetical protein [Paenibacillus sp. SGZ-1014]
MRNKMERKAKTALNRLRFVSSIPLIYTYLIMITDARIGTRILLGISLSTMLIMYKLSRIQLQELKKEFGNLLILLIVLSGILFMIQYNQVYFFIGIMITIILVYKSFEFLGDKIEAFIISKSDMPLISILTIKLLVWFTGFFFFVFVSLFFTFVFKSQYPHDTIVLIVLDPKSKLLAVIGVIIACILLAFFTLDFLIKMVFRNNKFTGLKRLTRLELQQLFMQLMLITIFADMSYGLLYLGLFDSSMPHIQSIADFVPLLNEYLQAVYYAFCLHFAIPMPTSSFYVAIDAAVKRNTIFYIVQFFHFLINKLVDITLLAYMASIVLSKLSFKKSDS